MQSQALDFKRLGAFLPLPSCRSKFDPGDQLFLTVPSNILCVCDKRLIYNDKWSAIFLDRAIDHAYTAPQQQSFTAVQK
ncbi:hypothetical protein [Nevskia sp.]|uniref:hypothetical protein n=1 Tax=Nevskia sp. TaxID=1929292 RepID=UPI0025DBD59E|nr:hypothetical protein [Nevskia sp.]